MPGELQREAARLKRDPYARGLRDAAHRYNELMGAGKSKEARAHVEKAEAALVASSGKSAGRVAGDLGRAINEQKAMRGAREYERARRGETRTSILEKPVRRFLTIKGRKIPIKG